MKFVPPPLEAVQLFVLKTKKKHAKKVPSGTNQGDEIRVILVQVMTHFLFVDVGHNICNYFPFYIFFLDSIVRVESVVRKIV